MATLPIWSAFCFRSLLSLAEHRRHADADAEHKTILSIISKTGSSHTANLAEARGEVKALALDLAETKNLVSQLTGIVVELRKELADFKGMSRDKHDATLRAVDSLASVKA